MKKISLVVISFLLLFLVSTISPIYADSTCDSLGESCCGAPVPHCDPPFVCDSSTLKCAPNPTCDEPNEPCCSNLSCVPPLICAKLPQIGSGLCSTSGTLGTPGPTIPVYDPGCSSGTSYYGYSGVKTALGCLPTDPQAFINTATPWAVGVGAGIAFLLGVFGAIMIVLSAGNPEKMQAGKEMITSAIGGMILIIFSVFLLKVIGVDVLKLF